MEQLNAQYGFTYNNQYDPNSLDFPNQTSASKTITLTDDKHWAVVMREFANFLSGIYGYNITGQVFIKDTNYLGEEGFESLSDF